LKGGERGGGPLLKEVVRGRQRVPPDSSVAFRNAEEAGGGEKGQRL